VPSSTTAIQDSFDLRPIRAWVKYQPAVLHRCQGVDETEGGDTGADTERDGKHRGRGRDLVAAELPPAETYIGENRLKPSGSTNAVARLASMQRGAECTVRFLSIPS
jgi:hypothetical protein